MTHADENTTKVHYICQTYVAQKLGPDGHASLKIGKQFQYSTAAEGPRIELNGKPSPTTAPVLMPT